MENNAYNSINSFLDGILINLITKQQIEVEELKNLLLICYYQLIDSNPDKLTNSLLITTLKQFIDIEDYYNIILPMQQANCHESWDDSKIDHYLESLAHPRIIEITNGDN